MAAFVVQMNFAMYARSAVGSISLWKTRESSEQWLATAGGRLGCNLS